MALYSYPYPSYNWAYQGVDYAGIANLSQQLANDMYADGIRFVGRYLYQAKYPNGKGITAQEAQYYLNAGIKIFLYYEVDTTDALGGYARGVQNGQACLVEANALSVPNGTQIYCCCDTTVTEQQAQGVVMDYLRGFAEQLPNYNVGIYGGTWVTLACYNESPSYYRCQAGAWGNEEFSPIDVRQWLIAYNRQAMNDGRINIQNITIDSNGYAAWRGNPVDLCSAPDLENMWGDDTPTPPTPTGDTKMPIWMYLKLF